MKVKKVNGGYRVSTKVCGCSFGKTYFGVNRAQAVAMHTEMANVAIRYGSGWIDSPRFYEYC